MTAPFGGMNPNSQHQMWSRWFFGVMASTKHPTDEECIDNARRFFRKGFGSCGQVRLDRRGAYYRFVVEVEGPPAHDPAYEASVEKQFTERFMAPGFGPGARLIRCKVRILAGDKQDGKPRDQLLVMPLLVVEPRLFGI